MYQKILVPTDGSALADQAVTAAIDYARCAGAVVVAFSVAQPYPMLPMVDGAMMIDPVVDSAELQRLAQQAVDAIARTAQAAGVACETHTSLSFVPYEEIIRAAGEYGCDVIFMASHGRRGLSRLLAGSQTQKVLAYSSIPVMVLRPASPVP